MKWTYLSAFLICTSLVTLQLQAACDMVTHTENSNHTCLNDDDCEPGRDCNRFTRHCNACTSKLPFHVACYADVACTYKTNHGEEVTHLFKDVGPENICYLHGIFSSCRVNAEWNDKAGSPLHNWCHSIMPTISGATSVVNATVKCHNQPSIPLSSSENHFVL